MLTHGVLGVVPRLRRSLPRRAKRRNESAPSGNSSEPPARRNCRRPPSLGEAAQSPRGNDAGARENSSEPPASRGNEISRRELCAAPRQDAACAAPSPRHPRIVGASERRHNPENPGRKPGDKPPQNQPRASERRHNLPRGSEARGLLFDAHPRLRRAPTRFRASFPQKKKRSRSGLRAAGGNASFRAGFQCALAASRAAFFLSHLRTGSGIVPPSS